MRIAAITGAIFALLGQNLHANSAERCGEFSCDSTFVESMLLENGIEGVNIALRIKKERGRIVELDLSYLDIQTISGKISSLAELRELNVEGTHFPTLPFSLTQLKNLQRLEVGPNQFISNDTLSLQTFNRTNRPPPRGRSHKNLGLLMAAGAGGFLSAYEKTDAKIYKAQAAGDGLHPLVELKAGLQLKFLTLYSHLTYAPLAFGKIARPASDFEDHSLTVWNPGLGLDFHYYTPASGYKKGYFFTLRYQYAYAFDGGEFFAHSGVFVVGGGANFFGKYSLAVRGLNGRLEASRKKLEYNGVQILVSRHIEFWVR